MQLAARLAAILLALTCIAPVAQAATGLRHFTLIEGTGHDPVPGSTLMVDGGRITWAGSTMQLRIPAGATVVDLKGKFVTPGPIEDHVYVGLVRDVAQDIKSHTIFGIRAGQGKAHPEMAEARRAVDPAIAKRVDLIKLRVDDEFGDLPSRMPAEISKAIIDQAHEHQLRALAHLFYRDSAKTLVRMGSLGSCIACAISPLISRK